MKKKGNNACMYIYWRGKDYKRVRRPTVRNTHRRQCADAGSQECTMQALQSIFYCAPGYSLTIPSRQTFSFARMGGRKINKSGTGQYILTVMVIM